MFLNISSCRRKQTADQAKPALCKVTELSQSGKAIPLETTMDSIIDTQPLLQPYRLSLLVLAALCLVLLAQAFLTAPLAFIKQEQVPGGPLRGDPTMFSFRVIRTYANSVETLPAFGFALLLAIVSGMSSALVNVTALTFLVARLAFWVIYYAGVGKQAGGPRTLCFVVCLVGNLVLAIAAAAALS